MLHAERLNADPRLAEAKRALIDLVREHAAEITGPRPPAPSQAEAFTSRAELASRVRGRPLILPYLGSGLGNGPWVELTDGSVKLDFISGIGVHVLGHSHPAIVEASIDAALSDTVMEGNLQMNPDSLELGDALLRLANRSGANLAHCFLTTSGAMANENALKILFQKHAPASRLLAFEGAFAGRSLVTSQITDRPEYREGLPRTIEVDRIPYFHPERPEASTDEAVAALERHLAAHPGQHAGMVFELILGEGGFYPGGSAFFTALLERLREAGVGILLDEIQSFGRTSQPFAFQHFGLDAFADVVTVGKMTQVCATLYRADLNPKPALLSQTFTAGTAAIRAALAILAELEKRGSWGEHGTILRLGRAFTDGLQQLAERYPDRVEGPFGLGGMIGFTPYGGDPGQTKDFVNRLFEAGLMGFPAGKDPARVRFLLPHGVIDESHIETALGLLETTLTS